MLGELLGEWMRLSGSGSIAQYREKAIWLAGTVDARLEQGEPGRWLRDLSDRGYVELHWDAGKWTCSPLAMTRLPNSDGLAVLAGFPDPGVLRALSDFDIDTHTVECTPPGDGRLARPAATIIQYSAVADLRDAAAAISATYIPCSAWQLALTLRSVTLGHESAPPNRQNDTIAQFDARNLRWSPPADLAAVGLYRYEGNGRRNFLWHEAGIWRHCDMTAGIWTALARSNTSAIRWRPHPGHDPASGAGTLFADLGAPMPPLHRRCLVLCSGLTPQFNSSAGTARYGNVPRGIADIIWHTLGQSPHILDEGDAS